MELSDVPIVAGVFTTWGRRHQSWVEIRIKVRVFTL